MIKQFELYFWNFTIHCMQKPNMRKAIRKTSALDWQSITVVSAAVIGSTLGLLAAYLISSIL
jgi:hypothetical protein